MDSSQPFPPPPQPVQGVPLPGQFAEVVVEPVAPPKKSKTGWIIGGVVAVLALVGVGVFALGGDDDKGTAAREPYSLAAAATAATEANLIGFEMTMGAMGSEIVMEAQMDIGAKLMSMHMEMPLGMGEIEAIIDGGGNVMYLSAEAMGLGDQAPTPWISMDLTKIPGGTEDIFGASTSNPLAVAEFFANADGVEEVGMEEFRGETVRHYRVTVSMADALTANPDLQQQADDLGAELPDDVIYDVYVTEDSLLRRMTFEMALGGQTITADIVLTALDAIDPITIPPADQVTDMTSQMGG